jgi:hypothetical protein
MIHLYFVLILYLLYMCKILYMEQYNNYYDRRYELIALIHSKSIRSFEWSHHGQIFIIKLTKMSVAKVSRNTGIGIGIKEGIIIKHFWMDGKLHNTDTFSIKKLMF